VKPRARVSDLLAQAHLDVQMDVLEVLAELELPSVYLPLDLLEPSDNPSRPLPE
jgi:hypothetical protein